MRNAAARWLRPPVGRADGPLPHVRLVCLPHAGGTAGSYQGWSRHLPDSVEQLSVQYPGRQDRLADDPVESMDAMADLLTDVLLELEPLPLALFGHSMGGLVAYEVARRLEQRHGIVARHLFVSACPVPGHDRTYLPDPEDDGALLAFVDQQGGSAAGLYAHPKLGELLLPSLRADFRLLTTYRPPRSAGPLSAPVTALGGDRDTDCGPAELDAWSRLTRGAWNRHVLPGGHFYLEDAEAALLDVIVAELLTPARPVTR
ncbi:alpha/beta fold hydrolase [Streptomyces sp. NPDC005438]|uniref:thioesterase II family protein n=1 Tax=Streptomyces sp. NPDC005438 TaxID=3156880 RepID=UPI0033B63797